MRHARLDLISAIHALRLLSPSQAQALIHSCEQSTYGSAAGWDLDLDVIVAGVAVGRGKGAAGLAGVVINVLGNIDGEGVAGLAQGAAGTVDAVRGRARGAVRGVVGKGFHDVLFVVVGKTRELLLGSKVHLTWAAGHRDWCYVYVLWCHVLVLRSVVFVLGSVSVSGCSIPVSSRGVWVAR